MCLDEENWKEIFGDWRKVSFLQSSKLIYRSGFVGSHVIEALLARGETNIVNFDLCESPLFANEPKVRFIKGNFFPSIQLSSFRKSQQLSRGQVCSQRHRCGIHLILTHIHYISVFHCAAIVNYWAYLPFEGKPLETNITAAKVSSPFF
jgi:nucleoside-diphosphate-sugar epimerase